MFVIFETGGKQYRAKKGDTLDIEKLEENEGDTITFERVYLVSDGKDTSVGTPYVSGAKVTATVKKQFRGDKIRVVKFQSKKRHKTVNGHRQSLTQVEITGISK